MEYPKRYHPALVTIHWLTALLVFLNLFLGILIFERRSIPLQALGPYITIHMISGLTIIVLLVIRVFVRARTSKPADANSDNKFLDVLAKLVHYGLYVAVLAATLIGLLFSIQIGRFQSTFMGAKSQFGAAPGGSATQRTLRTPPVAPPAGGAETGQAGPGPQGGPGRSGGPGGGGGFSLLKIHEYSAYLLLGLVSLHILAALYHQIIRKDNLLARMGYGQRA